MLDAARVLAHDHRLHVLNAADHGARLAFQRGLAPAHQARLIGLNLDEHNNAMAAIGHDRGNACDFHSVLCNTHRLHSFARMENEHCPKLCRLQAVTVKRISMNKPAQCKSSLSSEIL